MFRYWFMLHRRRCWLVSSQLSERVVVRFTESFDHSFSDSSIMRLTLFLNEPSSIEQYFLTIFSLANLKVVILLLDSGVNYIGYFIYLDPFVYSMFFFYLCFPLYHIWWKYAYTYKFKMHLHNSPKMHTKSQLYSNHITSAYRVLRLIWRLQQSCNFVSPFCLPMLVRSLVI